jgi:hypothetical protein
MKSEKDSRIDTCVECYVRDRDFSKKKVHYCELCQKWFCEKHLSPKLVFIPDFEHVHKDPKIQLIYEKEYRRKDGHPDPVYTINWFKAHNEPMNEKEISIVESEADKQRRKASLEKSGFKLEESYESISSRRRLTAVIAAFIMIFITILILLIHYLQLSGMI